MVGRFNVRPGDGVTEWLVWDNAMNGHRGSGLSQAEANEVAADLELQYDVHGARDAANVRRVSPPVPVDAFQRAGVLDAWVLESGRWLGRVRQPDGRIAWIDQDDLRATPRSAQAPSQQEEAS
ncbi:hypothetical protein EV652_10353 [Kribbella steppae]|uniref:Uncharacterized protein n=1 Tax=Kribbella steppae TaxID=2512223 RepID=A0A4R2HPG5_9ACTN|nr:hypothetical protein [Kribbella steppae]TCO33054.1 hypothetical protein EV652_10353 [Kribbella steppae]